MGGTGGLPTVHHSSASIVIPIINIDKLFDSGIFENNSNMWSSFILKFLTILFVYLLLKPETNYENMMLFRSLSFITLIFFQTVADKGSL